MVDIEVEKECHKAFEKVIGLRTPMPSESCAMVVHMGANQYWLIYMGVPIINMDNVRIINNSYPKFTYLEL